MTQKQFNSLYVLVAFASGACCGMAIATPLWMGWLFTGANALLAIGMYILIKIRKRRDKTGEGVVRRILEAWDDLRPIMEAHPGAVMVLEATDGMPPIISVSLDKISP